MYEFSPYVEENFEFLKALANTRSENRKHQLLANATADQVLAIVEICANILNSNFILNNRQRRRLARYADFYRSLSRVRTERTAKRRILNQEGGALALGALLVPVLSVLAEHLLQKVLG